MKADTWTWWIYICLAAAFGVLLRYSIDSAISKRFAHRQKNIMSAVPFGTLLINITGSLAFGLVIGATATHGVLGISSESVRVWVGIAGVGFLGGYTTFSAASMEDATLVLQGRLWLAVLHMVIMLLASTAAAGLGLWLTTRCW